MRNESDVNRKTYVLDTCVLLADPYSLLQFEEHNVVLPLVVIEELDRHKTRMDEVGANARSTIRLLEDLGASRSGGLNTATPLPNGGTLRIEINGIVSERLPKALDPTTADHRIVATSFNLADAGNDTVLVTRDAAVRIKGAQLGIAVEDYRADAVFVDEAYTGVSELDVESSVIDALYEHGKVALDADRLVVNQFVVLRSGSQSALGRVADDTDAPVVVKVSGSQSVFGVESKNVRQAFALDLLMDPDIHAVSLMGMAGTGKTFLALAAALEQVVEAQRYRRVSVYRPLIAVGRQEMGFLPGDLDEKLAPWMAAVYDNLYALFAPAGTFGAHDAVEDLIERELIEMASVTYLRGRSISDELVIIDEAQNLELSTLKVILTRMGRNSKVVFCGDLSQIDNPYVSPFGGLAALIEKFKGVALYGHVTLEKSVRSPLAEMAATIL